MLLTAAACLLAAGADMQAQTPPAACPFQADELNKVLGLDAGAGQAQPPLKFAGGQMLGCQYPGNKRPSVRVNQTVMDKPDDPANAASFRMMAGSMKPVPGDPDSAMWQLDQGDNSNPTLHYLRKGHLVEVRVMVGKHDPQFQRYADALPKLRRVP